VQLLVTAEHCLHLNRFQFWNKSRVTIRLCQVCAHAPLIYQYSSTAHLLR